MRSSIATVSPTIASSSPCATGLAKYVADDAKWSQAEKELREALDTAGIAYDEEAGEAAFYGPKADFMAKDGSDASGSSPRSRSISSSRPPRLRVDRRGR